MLFILPRERISKTGGHSLMPGFLEASMVCNRKAWNTKLLPARQAAAIPLKCQTCGRHEAISSLAGTAWQIRVLKLFGVLRVAALIATGDSRLSVHIDREGLYPSVFFAGVSNR
jgi:hypothetical protein